MFKNFKRKTVGHEKVQHVPEKRQHKRSTHFERKNTYCTKKKCSRRTCPTQNCIYTTYVNFQSWTSTSIRESVVLVPHCLAKNTSIQGQGPRVQTNLKFQINSLVQNAQSKKKKGESRSWVFAFVVCSKQERALGPWPVWVL